MMQIHYEERLNTQYVAGAIFALKNFGWKDKSEIDTNTNAIVEFISKHEKDI